MVATEDTQKNPRKKYRDYPLLRNHIMSMEYLNNGGTAVLLIQRGNRFRKENYGFGEMALLVLMRKVLRGRRSIPIRELEIAVLKSDDLDVSLEVPGEVEFYRRTFDRLEKEGILSRMDIPTRKKDKTGIGFGSGYHTTRVYEFTPSRRRQDLWCPV